MTPCTAVDEISALPARRLQADDRLAIAEMFLRLSEESRRRRFLSVKPFLTEADLQRFTDVDHARREAVAALDVEGRIIAVAQYAESPTPGTAEIAVAVIDEYQGQGIGSALVGAIMRCARANGYMRLVATTLWENEAARALFRSFGFRACGIGDGLVELQLTG
jgi:RimJ/RimL family protein N-acetyltransferase